MFLMRRLASLIYLVYFKKKKLTKKVLGLGRLAGDHGACPRGSCSCPAAAALHGLCPIAASSKSQSSIIGQVACACSSGRSSICSSNCEASSVAVTGMDQIGSPLLLSPLPLLDWNLLANSFYVFIICLYFSGSSCSHEF
jgi:hypothetical protein